MTETEYKKKQTQDTNQLKKTFDAGYQKGRKEGIEEEHRIREYLWLHHGCPIGILYGDDGEMQCGNLRVHRSLDFKRMPITDLLDALAEDWKEIYRRAAERLKEQG